MYEICDCDLEDNESNEHQHVFENDGSCNSTDKDYESDSSESASSGDSEGDETSESEDDVDQDFESMDRWYEEDLFENSDTTLGEAVLDVLEIFVQNKHTKKSLGHILKTWHKHLPKPNSLPASKYLLMKLLNKLLPSGEKMVEKYRICDNCSNLLGEWTSSKTEILCDQCHSSETNGAFFEFDIRKLLKDLFEYRDLDDLLSLHKKESSAEENNYISDITSGSQYKIWEKVVINHEFDVCLLWNADATPLKASSNANAWLIQCQIVNIPVKNRRNFQFVAGIYYSKSEKPPMNSFFRPFVDSLISACAEGVQWFSKKTKENINSIAIAPMASCDAPARAEIQNMMYFNGEFGCFVCEIQGKTCEVGSGHNTVFIVDLKNPPERRTKERMHQQAKDCIQNKSEHEIGVKGPSVVSLIPHFDISKSFLPDFLHVFFLGLFRTLLSCWFGTSNKDKPYYVKKRLREQLGRELEKIRPPDSTMRIPRGLKHMKHYKGNEIEEICLHYFPILLKNKLKKEYYEHYLLIVYAVHTLLKKTIHVREIDHAQFLINLFLSELKEKYGENKLTYNSHIASHVAEYVRMYGPAWSWSTYPFEDFNGFFKQLVHGTNKIDIEVVNTLKICNAYHVLKHLMTSLLEKQEVNVNNRDKFTVISKNLLSAEESNKIEQHCHLKNVDPEYVILCSRAHFGKEVFTSIKYKNQEKRDNSHVCWYEKNDASLKYGIIQLFFKAENKIFSLVRELIPCDDSGIFNNRIRFPRIHVLVRPSYCLHEVALEDIQCKILRIEDYVVVPEFVGKR